MYKKLKYKLTDLCLNLNKEFGLNICKLVILAFNISSILLSDCKSSDVNINP
jgi:hypothetical protein